MKGKSRMGTGITDSALIPNKKHSDDWREEIGCLSVFAYMLGITLLSTCLDTNTNERKEKTQENKAHKEQYVPKPADTFDKYDKNNSKTLGPDEFIRIYQEKHGTDFGYLGSPKDTFDKYDKNNSRSLDSSEFVSFYK